jgi:hypothetical protein
MIGIDPGRTDLNPSISGSAPVNEKILAAKRIGRAFLQDRKPEYI